LRGFANLAAVNYLLVKLDGPFPANTRRQIRTWDFHLIRLLN